MPKHLIYNTKDPLVCVVCGSTDLNLFYSGNVCLDFKKKGTRDECCMHNYVCNSCTHIMEFIVPGTHLSHVTKTVCVNMAVGYNVFPLITSDGRKINMNDKKTSDSLNCPVCHLKGSTEKVPFQVFMNFDRYIQFRDQDDPITDYSHIHKKFKDIKEYIEQRQRESVGLEYVSRKRSDFNIENVGAGVAASMLFSMISGGGNSHGECQSQTHVDTLEGGGVAKWLAAIPAAIASYEGIIAFVSMILVLYLLRSSQSTIMEFYMKRILAENSKSMNKNHVEIFRAAFLPKYKTLVHENIRCKNCGYIFVMRNTKRYLTQMKNEVIQNIISSAGSSFRSSDNPDNTSIEVPFGTEMLPYQLTFQCLSNLTLHELRRLQNLTGDVKTMMMLSAIVKRSGNLKNDSIFTTSFHLRNMIQPLEHRYLEQKNTDIIDLMKEVESFIYSLSPHKDDQTSSTSLEVRCADIPDAMGKTIKEFEKLRQETTVLQQGQQLPKQELDISTALGIAEELAFKDEKWNLLKDAISFMGITIMAKSIPLTMNTQSADNCNVKRYLFPQPVHDWLDSGGSSDLLVQCSEFRLEQQLNTIHTLLNKDCPLFATDRHLLDRLQTALPSSDEVTQYSNLSTLTSSQLQELIALEKEYQKYADKVQKENIQARLGKFSFSSLAQFNRILSNIMIIVQTFIERMKLNTVGKKLHNSFILLQIEQMMLCMTSFDTFSGKSC